MVGQETFTNHPTTQPPNHLTAFGSRGFGWEITSLNRYQGARDLFRKLTGKEPSADFDRVVLPGSREVVFRSTSQSGTAKIEVVDYKQKFLEKITFPESLIL
ncbi:hypothetical protein HYR99_18290 [Candidatus Poribacteria bacterium]|nr:hypothetical protein [Candidatus Poribacteria bacterium]